MDRTMGRTAGRTAKTALMVACALVGCTGQLTLPPGPGPKPMPKPEPDPSPPSANVIDVAVWPRMVKAKTTKLTPASNAELCRRMSLDLVGSAPTADEAAALCTGKSPSEMAQAMMATPGFVLREQRLWVEHLRENAGQVHADYLVDADAILARFARGELGYDDFAAAILAHPATAINRRPTADVGDDETNVEYAKDVPSTAMRVFLGRMPVGGEANDFGNLFRPWRRVRVVDMQLNKDAQPYGAVLDPARCVDVVRGPEACTSRLLGAPTTVALPMGAAQAYETFGGKVPDAIERELERPGRLLATRSEFWEEAADHSLSRFVGWWKATRAEPDSDVPEVRAALGAWFRSQSGHDVRQLYLMVVTSILYTQTAELDAMAANTDLPPWTSGPTKPMAAEQWLDSVGKSLGRPMGFCDIHADEGIGSNMFYPDRLRQAQPADYYGFGFDFYYAVGASLGGCTAGRPHAREPGLPSLFVTVDAADTLCQGASILTPPGFDATDGSDGNVKKLVAFQFGRLLGREPATDELDAINKTAASCLPDQSCGMQLFAQTHCGALLRSGAFLFY